MNTSYSVSVSVDEKVLKIIVMMAPSKSNSFLLLAIWESKKKEKS